MTDFDMGEIFTRDFRIRAEAEGSFIVEGQAGEKWKGWARAFSNLADMMVWLNGHAEAYGKRGPQPPEVHGMTKMDVVKAA